MMPLASPPAPRLGVIETPRQLPHHHHVHAFQHRGFERTGVGQQRVDLHRPDIGEHAHVGPDIQQALLRTHRGVWVVPLGTSHRAEQHRVVRPRHRPHLIGEGDAVLVYRDAADVPVRQRERVPESGADSLHGPDPLVRNLRPDPVAAHNRNLELQGQTSSHKNRRQYTKSGDGVVGGGDRWGVDDTSRFGDGVAGS